MDYKIDLKKKVQAEIFITYKKIRKTTEIQITWKIKTKEKHSERTTQHFHTGLYPF